MWPRRFQKQSNDWIHHMNHQKPAKIRSEQPFQEDFSPQPLQDSQTSLAIQPPQSNIARRPDTSSPVIGTAPPLQHNEDAKPSPDLIVWVRHHVDTYQKTGPWKQNLTPSYFVKLVGDGEYWFRDKIILYLMLIFLLFIFRSKHSI